MPGAMSASAARDINIPSAARQDRYFFAVSFVLLAIVLVGFSRTLFLRALFQVPAIPWYVYVHGSVMTLWFVVLVAQTSLVAAHRTDLHRRLGILGALVAVVVVILGFAITLQVPAHLKAGGGATYTGGEKIPLQISTLIFWGDIAQLITFAIMIATAAWKRRRPDVHKRLMLLASIGFVTPSLGRMTEFPGFLGAAVPASIVPLLNLLPTVIVLTLYLSLAGHDLLTTRRLHHATLWGILGSFGAGTVFTFVMPGTAVARAVWVALAH